MTNRTTSFHRSTPIERNDGTPINMERPTERKSLKSIASAVLQRNAERNDIEEPFHEIQAFHRSTVREWNDGTIDAWGPFTPYCCAISVELVAELHRLIAEYAALYRLAENATTRIIDAAKRQPLMSVPESIAYFKKQIEEKS